MPTNTNKNQPSWPIPSSTFHSNGFTKREEAALRIAAASMTGRIMTSGQILSVVDQLFDELDKLELSTKAVNKSGAVKRRARK